MPAGQRLTAGRFPGERIATDIRISDSAAFTTVETSVASVTADLVAGRTYRVRFVCAWASTVAADTVFARIRENSVGGTQLQILRVEIPATGGAGTRWGQAIEVEYTAAASGSKTFHGTGIRASGTGNVTAEGDATFPIYLYLDYIRG